VGYKNKVSEARANQRVWVGQEIFGVERTAKKGQGESCNNTKEDPTGKFWKEAVSSKRVGEAGGLELLVTMKATFGNEGDVRTVRGGAETPRGET